MRENRLQATKVIRVHKNKDYFCIKLDGVLIRITLCRMNEFKEGKMKDWRELSLFLPIIISLTPCSLARFPEKIAMSARLWGTRKMCPAGYKEGKHEALFVCHK